MKYSVDHDFHIHSFLDPFSRDKTMSTERILRYGIENGYKQICLTDHFWDGNVKVNYEGWIDCWRDNDYKDNSVVLPLPQSESCKFLWGCEADMSLLDDIGITKETCDKFDFVIISTTHLHMPGFAADPNMKTLEEYREAYFRRTMKALEADLPHEKIGIAHLTGTVCCPPFLLEFFESMPDSIYREIFEGMKARGCGVELNFKLEQYGDKPEEMEHRLLRPYRIAKDIGCKFYFGSDSHSPIHFDGVKERYEKTVELLGLTEDDKFHVPNTTK